MEGYTIRCGSCIYITLEWNDKFIRCYDNDMMYAQDIILEIEKRTGLNFQDITVKGSKEDFRGLRFFNGGWHRKFCEEFPSREELNA